MRELAVQASNGTNTSEDLPRPCPDQINQYTAQIDNIGNTTQFNTMNLLNGGAGLQTNFTSMTVGGANENWLQVVGGFASTRDRRPDVTAATAANGATTTVVVTGETAGSQSFSLNGTTLTYTATGTGATDAVTVAAL